MEEQSSVSWVGLWIDEQSCCDNLRPNPAVAVARLITLAITPPGELTRWLLTTFEHNIARCRRKIRTARAVKNRPADSDHAELQLATCLPVKSQGEALVFISQMAWFCARFAQNRQPESNPNKYETSCHAVDLRANVCRIMRHDTWIRLELR